MDARGSRTQSKIELLDEKELVLWKRKYHNLLAERKSIKSRGVKILNDTKRLRILREEKANTGFEIGLEKCSCKKEEPLLVELEGLLKNRQKLAEDIEHARLRTLEIDDKLELVRNKIRKQTQQLHAVEEREKTSADSGLTRAQNKLETITRSVCLILADNKKLQEELINLIKERKEFNKMWEKQMKRLSTGKKAVGDLVEATEVTYSNQTLWVKKIKDLENNAMHVYNQQAEEMRHCQRQLDMNSGLSKFLGTKLQKRRVPVDRLDAERREPDRLKEDMRNRVNKFKEMLDQIKSYTAEQNIHNISKQFVQRELTNMTMFQEVLKVTDEIEFLSRDVEDLHSKITDGRRNNEEIKRKEAEEIKCLEDELACERIKNDEAELFANVKKIELEQIIRGVTSLFTMLKCERTPLLELGDNKTINQFNILRYLMILEEKIMRVLINDYVMNQGKPKFSENMG